MDLFDEFSDCQTEADPTSPDLARDRRRGGTWGRVQTPAVTATFWKPLVRRRADQRQDPRPNGGSLRRWLRVSNNNKDMTRPWRRLTASTAQSK